MGSMYSDEEQTQIETLWEKGYSASQIAQILGTGRSRNAIIGYAYRNMPGRARRVSPGRNGSYKTPRAPKPKAPRAAALKVHADMRQEKAPAPRLDAPEPLNLRLEDMGARQCRYACNDARSWQTHLFCGAPTPEGSFWCEYHKALVYVPSIEKTRRKRADILFQAGL